MDRILKTVCKVQLNAGPKVGRNVYTVHALDLKKL